MEDELLKSLLRGRKYKWSVEEQLKDIISLLAPVLADAEKWRKVRKIFFDCSPCTGCTGCDIGSSESCKMVMRVNRFIGSNGVEALEGEGIRRKR